MHGTIPIARAQTDEGFSPRQIDNGLGTTPEASSTVDVDDLDQADEQDAPVVPILPPPHLCVPLAACTMTSVTSHVY